MAQKSRTSVFKFLTPVTSVEKTENNHAFKKVYISQNINVLFSQCGSLTAWQQHISPQVTMKRIRKCCIYSAMDENDVDMLWNIRGVCAGD
jgi:hypothetical protein